MDPKVWTLLLIVIAVSLVLLVVLKVLARVVADRRTKNIILTGMSPEDKSVQSTSSSPSSGPDSRNETDDS
ncbi:MAG: hypothetical protein J7M25_16245 [Deltaproteobacteria bacterium]|nr:hypothetical protein [Deltaproteobacteria bacterium]